MKRILAMLLASMLCLMLFAGCDGGEMRTLKQKYPNYFDMQGEDLTVYAWINEENTVSCGLLSGKKGDHSEDEIRALPAASLTEMRQILATYDGEAKNIDYVNRSHKAEGTDFHSYYFTRYAFRADDKEAAMREKFPTWFDLPLYYSGAGTWLYYYLTEEGEERYALSHGKHIYRKEELLDMPAATEEEMRVIMASYTDFTDNIILIRWSPEVDDYSIEFRYMVSSSLLDREELEEWVQWEERTKKDLPSEQELRERLGMNLPNHLT